MAHTPYRRGKRWARSSCPSPQSSEAAEPQGDPSAAHRAHGNPGPHWEEHMDYLRENILRHTLFFCSACLLENERLTLSWCESDRVPQPDADEHVPPDEKQRHHGLWSWTALCKDNAYPWTYTHIHTHSTFLYHNPGAWAWPWPTYMLSCWMDVLMWWISSVIRRSRARCATTSVCRAFRRQGIRSSRDW